jgi:DNA-binding GntR family transcriptional regulator
MVVSRRQDLSELSTDGEDIWKLDEEKAVTKAEKIVAALRQAIVTLRLQSGMALSEQDIAGKFSVSRQPVREAFIRLSSSGLIVIRPQRATLVSHISLHMIEDAHFVRQAVELEIVRRAARAATADDIADLERQLSAQRQAGREKDARRFFALDEQFHRRLAAVAGRPNAWRAIEDGKAQLDRVRYLTLLEERPLRQRIEQHADIIKAIAARKPAAAARAMQEHLSGMMISLPGLFRKWPHLFEAATSSIEGHRRFASHTSRSGVHLDGTPRGS